MTANLEKLQQAIEELEAALDAGDNVKVGASIEGSQPGGATMTKQEAGRIGGRATASKHGRAHMQRIGKRGAVVTHSRYSIKPIGQTQYAYVYRDSGVIKTIW